MSPRLAGRRSSQAAADDRRYHVTAELGTRSVTLQRVEQMGAHSTAHAPSRRSLTVNFVILPRMGAFIVLAAVGCLTWVFVSEHFGWPGSVAWSAARSRRREQERLAAASADQLAGEALGCVRYGRWERFASVRPLLERSVGWSDAELSECLERLFAELSQEDRSRGSNGRDGHVYEYHDCGLGRIHEALASRAQGR